MKGLVTMPLNERQQNPGVNAPITRFYSTNQVIEIADAIIGDTYDGNNVWYRLKDGAYVWSGAIELIPEFTGMKELDKYQFLISYRQIDVHDGSRINVNTKEPPEKLYFARLTLPSSVDTVRANELLPGPFASSVVQSVRELKDPNRTHVFIYIHGFQAFPSLKLNLFTHFVENYMSQPGNKIAKAIFMVWPAQGMSRKKADDRALDAGKAFTKKNMFETFFELSRQLNAAGMHLNLIVHSFGHQLLNGMVNPLPKIPADLNGKTFDNIFLMASDVTHLSIRKDGVELENYYSDSNDKVLYNYAPLKELANKVHIFYDEQDILLYASTKKFVAKRDHDQPAIMNNYRNLGNYGGDAILPPEVVESGFNFHSVLKLDGINASDGLLNFPYREMEMYTQRIVEKARKNDYGDVQLLDVILHLQRYPNYHRYLYTCKPVVEKVNGLLA